VSIWEAWESGGVDLHLAVFDPDGVGVDRTTGDGNAFAGLDLEFPAVQRAGDGVAVDPTAREWRADMWTFVIDGVEGAIEIEEGEAFAGDHHGHAFAGCQVFSFGYGFEGHGW